MKATERRRFWIELLVIARTQSQDSSSLTGLQVFRYRNRIVLFALQQSPVFHVYQGVSSRDHLTLFRQAVQQCRQAHRVVQISSLEIRACVNRASTCKASLVGSEAGLKSIQSAHIVFKSPCSLHFPIQGDKWPIDEHALLRTIWVELFGVVSFSRTDYEVHETMCSFCSVPV